MSDGKCEKAGCADHDTFEGDMGNWRKRVVVCEAHSAEWDADEGAEELAFAETLLHVELDCHVAAGRVAEAQSAAHKLRRQHKVGRKYAAEWLAGPKRMLRLMSVVPLVRPAPIERFVPAEAVFEVAALSGQLVLNAVDAEAMGFQQRVHQSRAPVKVTVLVPRASRAGEP